MVPELVGSFQLGQNIVHIRLALVHKSSGLHTFNFFKSREDFKKQVMGVLEPF